MRHTHLLRCLVASSALFALTSCTEARLQSVPPPEPEPLDNLLEIRGGYCTEESDTVTFPLKVLFVFDQSASLQCTDQAELRFGALDNALESLRRRPATEFGAIGFASWSNIAEFTRDRGTINDLLGPEAGLGPATDYQGSLATAARLIEEDLTQSGPAERARTRYIINFVSDGIAEPRCNAGCEDTVDACSDGEDNDGDGIADASDPDCVDVGNNATHPDNLYGVCNTDQEVPEDVYVDMTGVCPEYNQPRQIQQRIQEILDLKDAYGVGDITLNTVLLFSPQDVVESVCPGAGADFGYTKDQAKALLQSMANTGNGTFRDVNIAQGEDDYLSFDVTSIEADRTLTMMTSVNEHARLDPTNAELLADSDRDGLPDEREVALGTNRNRADTDGDRYSDFFEVTFESEGFGATDKGQPATTCSNGRDGDGDGLNDCEEAFLGTDPNQPDTDADGILDLRELQMGLDPLTPDALNDLDFDGILNGEEVNSGTDPLRPDAERYRTDRIVYDVDEEGLIEFENPNNGNTEERRCYEYTIERIPLVATPLVADRGLNRILVKTSERPSKVSGVPGTVRVACFEAFYNGETIKTPASGVIDVTPENLERTRADLLEKMDTLAACPYFPQPTDPMAPATRITRGDLTEMMSSCMPRKVELDRRLYQRDELEDLIARHVDAEGFPKIEERYYDLFVPIQNFRPDRDCWRPWELDLVDRLLADVSDACNACVSEDEEAEEMMEASTP